MDTQLPIPYSIEAEEAVLGAVLNTPDIFVELDAFLQADHFFILRHQYIFEAMKRVHDRKEPPDMVLVQNELRTRGQLEDIGGDQYLMQLSRQGASNSHTEIYGRLVERSFIRRRLMSAADTIKALAIQEDMTAFEALAAAEQQILTITTDQRDIEDISFQAHISDYFDDLERLMKNPDELLGIPSGFKDLDHLLSGLQKSDLLIFAARPGMGKTAMLVNIALHAARLKQRVGFITLEMGTKQIIQRMVATETGINLKMLRTGKIHNGDWQKFIDATARIADFQIFIDDTSALTPAQIRQRVQRWKHQHGIDLLIVDYLQKMGSGSAFRPDNRVQEVSYFARSLKDMAKDFNIPVLSAAQLSRAVEQRQDKRPVLSDLRDSGEIEQEADIVMFLYRDEEYNPNTQFPNQAEIHVAKHRNGPTGTITLYFDKACTKFQSAAMRTVHLQDFAGDNRYDD